MSEQKTKLQQLKEKVEKRKSGIELRSNSMEELYPHYCGVTTLVKETLVDELDWVLEQIEELEGEDALNSESVVMNRGKIYFKCKGCGIEHIKNHNYYTAVWCECGLKHVFRTTGEHGVEPQDEKQKPETPLPEKITGEPSKHNIDEVFALIIERVDQIIDYLEERDT